VNIYQKLITATAGTAAVLLISGSAYAQGFEERMTVTFSAPVEVPGEVLPAGTYVFEVLQQGGLTRIVSPDELHVYATLITVPEEKKEPAGDGTVILKKNNEGGPERVDAWFLPGESVGCEFVYTKESHKTLGAVVDSSGKKVGHATEKAAKDVEVSSEFVGVHAAHAGETVGVAFYHAGKFLVT